jgi:uncharacterized membrane protein YcgQ (UPF0703/DUF1980 family)
MVLSWLQILTFAAYMYILLCMSCVFSVVQSYAHISSPVVHVARFKLQLPCYSIFVVPSLCCDYVIANIQLGVEDPWH